LSEDLLPREEDKAGQGRREAEALTLICLTGTVHQQHLLRGGITLLVTLPSSVSTTI